MSRYRIMIIVEERTGESVGEEIVDFTETIGWSDDLAAVADFISRVLAQAESMSPTDGVTQNDPNYWTREEYDRIRDKDTAVCPLDNCTAYPNGNGGYECADCGYVIKKESE